MEKLEPRQKEDCVNGMRISCLQSKLQLGVVYHRSCCTYLTAAVESRFEILSFIWLWIWLIACVSPKVELKIIQRINQRVARPNGNEACQRLSIARAREIRDREIHCEPGLAWRGFFRVTSN